MNGNRQTAQFLPLMALLVSALLLNASAYAQAAGQKTFPTSQDALEAFIQATRADDTAQLQAILGPDSEQILNSGDPVADAHARAGFLKKYDEKHSLAPSADGLTLEVGNDGWPLPIPLVHSGDKWYWDGAAGKEEILYRRIGRNELAAIKVCKGVVAAQSDYAASAHDGEPAGMYAHRIVSQPGKENGLYWEVKAGEPPSPAGPMLAQAAAEGYDTSGKRVPYHGYYYRMIPSAQGFGFLAYPAEYRSSGVMTFLVNEKGVIYEKDLGANTAEIAQQMTSDTPDETWSPVK